MRVFLKVPTIGKMWPDIPVSLVLSSLGLRFSIPINWATFWEHRFFPAPLSKRAVTLDFLIFIVM